MLSIASPMFAENLSNDCTKIKNKVIEIKDFSFWFDTQELNDIADSASLLLFVSWKNNLVELFSLCEEFHKPEKTKN